MEDQAGGTANGNRAVLIRSRQEAEALMHRIGVGHGGIRAMEDKALFETVLLNAVSSPAANIIKQEMLAAGGDAALSRESVSSLEETDVLLMGTRRQFRQALEVLKHCSFELPHLVSQVEGILSAVLQSPEDLPLPGGISLELGRRTHIMGILNVTPDSFSDGGLYIEPSRALERALEMREQGADIIDIGAVSSRPGGELATESEEMRRLMPVLESLQGQGLVISVDTFRAGVAAAALQCGAHIVNDIGALAFDREMLPTLLNYEAPLIIMHNRLQRPSAEPYRDIVGDICEEMRACIAEAMAAGLDEKRIIIDPGIGFGKDPAENCFLIQRLREFKSLGRPVLIGASRKRFIGHTLGLDVDQRLEGSLAVLVLSIAGGANIIRVHDVLESKRAAVMADAVVRENG